MRHRVKKQRLGRITPQRKALLKGLLTSLLKHGKITTTQNRAKALVSAFDELVATVARQGEMHNKIRAAKEALFEEEAQRVLISNILPKFEQKRSGFTRTTRLGTRNGDAAEMLLVEIL